MRNPFRQPNPAATRIGSMPAGTRLLGLVLLLVSLPLLAAGEPGVISEPARMLEAPAGDAGLIAELPAGTPVERLERRDGWMRIATDEDTGWVRVWQFREAGIAGEGGGEGGLLSGLQRFSRAATGLFTREPAGDDAGNTTAAIGTRGLGVGEAARAAPDPAARERVDGYRVDSRAARDYADDAGLTR